MNIRIYYVHEIQNAECHMSDSRHSRMMYKDEDEDEDGHKHEHGKSPDTHARARARAHTQAASASVSVSEMAHNAASIIIVMVTFSFSVFCIFICDMPVPETNNSGHGHASASAPHSPALAPTSASTLPSRQASKRAQEHMHLHLHPPSPFNITNGTITIQPGLVSAESALQAGIQTSCCGPLRHQRLCSVYCTMHRDFQIAMHDDAPAGLKFTASQNSKNLLPMHQHGKGWVFLGGGEARLRPSVARVRLILQEMQSLLPRAYCHTGLYCHGQTLAFLRSSAQRPVGVKPGN
jgi:hypothetical protein